MTLAEFIEATKDMPKDTPLLKWNTNYGWTEVHSVKHSKFEDGSSSIDIV
jgi:hypothetical protein